MAKPYWSSRVSLHRFSLIFFFYLYYVTTSKVLPQGCVDLSQLKSKLRQIQN